MMQLTAGELTAIREQLTQEQTLVAKYRYLAGETADRTLSQKYESIASRHEEHFKTLYGLLG